MRHLHEPARYHRTLGPHQEALRIAPGDTVETTCVDAGGRDHEDRQVTEPGNPMTGPFYVEGAEPADVVTIRFDDIVPTRSLARSASTISPYCLEQPYLREAPATGPEPLVAEWQVDGEAGVATLTEHASRLPGIALPIAPMLGCFGVAPASGEAQLSATAGPHGGNMDYRGFVAGVTVQLPVFAEGALLFVGDGHALQSEGEIAGSGLEISMRVTFTVGLRKGAPIAWPRGETDDHIFTVANARPLEQAAQHATTELLRWLTTEHSLDPLSAQLLMSQCVEYDVGKIVPSMSRTHSGYYVYDPAYTMVCRLPRSCLAQVAG